MKFDKKLKVLGLWIIILTMLVSLSACSGKEIVDEIEHEESKELSAKDDYGRMIALDKHPERIISLAPSNTEILFALGLDNEIIGVTDYCDYPEEAKKKEKIGGFAKSDAEKIISLRPDLVIGLGDPDEKLDSILRESDIPVISYNSSNIDEVMSQIERIGHITGKDEEASRLVKDMEDKRSKIVDRVKDLEKFKVFYEIWDTPLTAAGKGSFMDELIGLAGGDNIAKDSKVAYPEYDIELLISKNPDIYLTTEDDSGKSAEDIKARPGYSGINAIKNNKIYFLDANITSRPGPRIVDALELVAEKIHPEAFPTNK